MSSPSPAVSPHVISLLCPTRGRPAQAVRLAQSVLSTATQPDRVELLFYVDANDPEQPRYVQQLEQRQLSAFKRCRLLVGEPIGVSKAWNELAARSQGDLLVMAADDQTYNDSGWDDRLDAEAAKFPDRIFCMWFNDGHWGSRLCTFPIVSRRWCLTLGYFTTGLFECLYDDLWIMDLAKRVGRLHYIPDVLTEHLHWSYGKSNIDATYEWKQVSAEGQVKPAVRRDMNLFGRTAPYRETDAKRLAAVMDAPPALQPGLPPIGSHSIFAGAPASRCDRPSPTIVRLCLPGDPEQRFQLSLQPDLPEQQQMLHAFRQGEFYCPEASQLFRQVLQPGDAVLDVGAHIGYFSLLAVQLVGSRGAVIAIEGDAAHYAQLVQNARLNQTVNLRTLRANLCPAAQTAPSATLDRLLELRSLPPLKLLRIATGGDVRQVLEGSLCLLQTQPVPYILCQVRPSDPAQIATADQALPTPLRSLGYAAHFLQAPAPGLVRSTVDLLLTRA